MPGRTGGGGATAAMCTTHRGAHNPTRCRGTDDSKQPCDDCCCYNRHHDDSPTNTCPMQQVACWTLSSVHVDVATAQPVAQALVPLMQGPWAAWLAGALRALVASALSEPRALVTLAHAGLRVFEAACRCVFLSVVFAHSLHTSDNHVMLFARVMMTTMGLICQSCLSLHAHQAARVLCGAAPKPTRTARHRPHPRPRGRPPSPRRPRPRPPPPTAAGRMRSSVQVRFRTRPPQARSVSQILRWEPLPACWQWWRRPWQFRRRCPTTRLRSSRRRWC